jgi:hypothetical protein
MNDFSKFLLFLLHYLPFKTFIMKMFKFLPFILLLTFISCNKEDNEKFVGTYTGEVNCATEGGPFPTTITISAVSNTSDQVNIRLESDGDSSDFTGTVVDDVLTIPEEDRDDIDIVSGTGSLKDKSLTIVFTLIDGTCTFVGSR